VDLAKGEEYQDLELKWMKDIAQEHGEKVSMTWVLGFSNDPRSLAMVDLQLGFLEEIKAAGGHAVAQSFVRPQGFLWSFVARLHPFLLSPTFTSLQQQCRAENRDLVTALRVPGARQRILAETTAMEGSPAHQEFFNMLRPWDLVYRWTPHYEPTRADSVQAISEGLGRTPLEVSYDLLASDGALWKPFVTWGARNLSPHHRLLMHPQVVPGGDDAGAHHTVIMDATNSSHMLTHWVRDRTRGPRLTLEHAVRKMTHEIAQLFSLHDRGTLEVGKKADLNVLDLSRMEMCKPFFVNDLPLGAGRWLQEVKGYRLTVVSGRATYRDGVPTGILPGRLVRNPRRRPEVWRGVAASVAGPFDPDEARGLPPSLHGASHAPDDGRAKALEALQGAGRGGASAGARVLREVVEKPVSKL